MKVSIITSCYNREKTIRGAVESVLAQDYPARCTRSDKPETIRIVFYLHL